MNNMEEKEFKTLGDRMTYYRGLFDYRLKPKSYILGILDGRSFSKRWKNKLDKPFDDGFISDMNETAKYLCENIAGCKFAFVQSDEINLFLCDYENEETQPWFDYRMSKMLSLSSAMASGKYNQLRLVRYLEETVLDVIDYYDEDGELFKQVFKDGREVYYDEGEAPEPYTIYDKIRNFKLSEFDSKFWSVPERNDAIAWFIFRQNDCIRNSILQAGYTYFSHKQLEGVKTTEIKERLISETGIDWNQYPQGQKYGRYICKVVNNDTNRSKWIVKDAPVFKEMDGRSILELLIPEKNSL
jgi:tRNA(His) 5'-end guanylyltransferase